MNSSGVSSELRAAASRQLDLISTRQAARLGIGPDLVDQLRISGRIVELGWSVFQLEPSDVAPRYAYPYGAWLALAPDAFAWERRAVHDDAVLSHESACHVWGLGSLPIAMTTFTAPSRLPAPAGIEVRVASTHAPLDAAAVTVHHGVPVTTPHRTVVDLVRAHNDHDEVRRVLTDAVRLDLVDVGAVYADLRPLAQRLHFPGNGPEFAGRFLSDIPRDQLSGRNRRALVELVGSA